MFAKRLKEARDNASDLLREAERKLGNAMTLEDLGPQIKLQEASNDSPWYEAAGGRRSGDRRSPNLKAVKDEEVGGRLSVSSDRSSEGGRGRTSPVLGGMPGATGVFGMLMGTEGRRESGDSWGWGAGDAEDDDWEKDENLVTGKKKTSS